MTLLRPMTVTGHVACLFVDCELSVDTPCLQRKQQISCTDRNLHLNEGAGFGLSKLAQAAQSIDASFLGTSLAVEPGFDPATHPNQAASHGLLAGCFSGGAS